jgi:GT2 family glycosyltransferase
VNVAIVVVAYNQPDWTRRLFASAVSAKHDLVFDLHLHSDDPATAAVCEEVAAADGVTHHPHGVNRGLSRTWNDGLLAGFDDGAEVVIVANDDVAFSPGDVDRLAEKASRHPDRYMVSCAGYHHAFGRMIPSHGYSCFAVNPVALEVLGCFDENFFPIYCEDQDYARRAALSGLAEENCADTNVHHGGSSAILSSEELRRQNAHTQSLNFGYYARKWGGLAGHETFATPFGDPELTLRIAREDRAAPYGPARDRTDHAVVLR